MDYSESGALVGRDPGDLLFSEQDLSGIRTWLPGDGLEERALARAVGAEDETNSPWFRVMDAW